MERKERKLENIGGEAGKTQKGSDEERQVKGKAWKSGIGGVDCVNL